MDLFTPIALVSHFTVAAKMRGTFDGEALFYGMWQREKSACVGQNLSASLGREHRVPNIEASGFWRDFR